MARGQELFDRKNCTLEESINFRALSNCRAEFVILHIDGERVVIGDITPEEYALKKGTAKDFERYVDIIFFRHFDEKKFYEERNILYDEYLRKCNESQSDDDSYYYDTDYCKLLNDDHLERVYGPAVKGRALSKKMRRPDYF